MTNPIHRFSTATHFSERRRHYRLKNPLVQARRCLLSLALIWSVAAACFSQEAVPFERNGNVVFDVSGLDINGSQTTLSQAEVAITEPSGDLNRGTSPLMKFTAPVRVGVNVVSMLPALATIAAGDYRAWVRVLDSAMVASVWLDGLVLAVPAVVVPDEITIWPLTPGEGPLQSDSGESTAYELGVKITASEAGEIRGVRFYKSSGNTGAHKGHVWAPDGTQLAEVTFAGETASGWQEARFSSPVLVQAGSDFLVSYWCPSGHYAVTRNYFPATGVTKAPLTASTGIFLAGSSGLPNKTYLASNYWVDLVWHTGSGEPPPPPPPPVPTKALITFEAPGVDLNGIPVVLTSAEIKLVARGAGSGSTQVAKTTLVPVPGFNTVDVASLLAPLPAAEYDAWLRARDGAGWGSYAGPYRFKVPITDPQPVQPLIPATVPERVKKIQVEVR